MGANATNGPVFFNMDPPKIIDTDSQAHYEEVCQSNKELLQSLTDKIHGYCLDGNCQDLGLLLRAVSYLFQSGEQILLDNKICQSCGDRSCSAAGSGAGVVDV